MSLESTLTNAPLPFYGWNKAVCTFAPRGRNRFACTTCKTDGGGPIVLKRSQLDGHRQNTFMQGRKLPPAPSPITVTRPALRMRTPTATPSPLYLPVPSALAQKKLGERWIESYAEDWLCLNCYEPNSFEAGLGRNGFMGFIPCKGCGRQIQIYRH